MFWERVLNVLLPLSNTDCLTKPFSSTNTPLFARKCINYFRKVSSQRCHLCLGKFCLVYSTFPRRMDLINLYLILILRSVELVSHYHFKMDSPYTKIKLNQKLLHGLYWHEAWTPITPFPIGFQIENVYEFTYLPNGLSCAPRIFIKIIKSPLSTLHTLGHTAVEHLDDLYLQGKIEKCVQNV